MEPRMDSGMRVTAAATEKKKWTVKNAKSRAHFPADEILGITDGLLLKLISWLSGSHLSQTLFSCVLIHEPHACQSAILKALMIAVLKIASRVKGIVEHVRVVEDDEFFGFLPFGLSLANEVADAEAVDTLQTIEGSLMADLKNVKRRVEGNEDEGLSAEDLAEGSEKLEFPESCTTDLQRIQYLEAVIHRIQFFRALLASLNYISKRNLGNAKRTLTTCLTLVDLCLLRIAIVKDMSVAFDTEVNKKLMHDSPPRTVSEPESITAAYNQIKTILENLLEIVSLPVAGLTLDETLSFISYFGRCRPGTGNTLIRSIVVLHFTHGQKLHGRMTYPSALIQSITNAYPPSAVSHFASTDSFVKTSVNEFVNLMATSMEPNGVGGGILERLLIVEGGFNRALGRRNLGKIAKDLEAIQIVTEGIDNGIHEHLAKGTIFSSPKPLNETYYLSSWTYELKLSILETYLMMGFELGLYSEFEYPTVFWYMDHIYEMHISHLNRMSQVNNRTNSTILELMWQFQQQADHGSANASVSSAKKSPKGSKKGAGSNAAPKPVSLDTFVGKVFSLVSSWDLKEALLITRQLVGRANMLFAFALRRDGFLKHPPFDFYSEEISYNQRFKLFLNMGSPVPQQFADFKNAEKLLLELPSLDLLQRSSLFLEEAKQLLGFITPFITRVESQSVVLKDIQQEAALLTESCTRNLDTIAKVASQKCGQGDVLTREDWKKAGFGPATGDKHAKCFAWDEIDSWNDYSRYPQTRIGKGIWVHFES
ncbi:UNVERIFIED_CONTAM: hypothetical protein HDU68_004336 [Siphonaria sp. JEL0065]|nr:hypothetical protein HDU68_004336 [Siphonaria sp. JEL0065]